MGSLLAPMSEVAGRISFKQEPEPEMTNKGRGVIFGATGAPPAKVVITAVLRRSYCPRNEIKSNPY